MNKAHYRDIHRRGLIDPIIHAMPNHHWLVTIRMDQRSENWRKYFRKHPYMGIVRSRKSRRDSL